MEKTHFYGYTDKSALDYKVNEPITFTVYPAENKKLAQRKDIIYYKWQITGDDDRCEEGYINVKETLVPLVLTTRLSRAGFVRVIVEACDGNKNPLPDIVRFEGGAGVDIKNIELATKIPDDFDKFWTEIMEDVNNTDISRAETTETNGEKGYRTYKIKIPAPYGKPAQGILTIPEKDGKYPAKIQFCGYGVSKTIPVYEKDVISLVINAHGIEPDAPQEYYDNLAQEPDGEIFYYGFDNIENSNPHTCYFKGMMARDLIASRFIRTLPQWNKINLTATGGSQGALQAVTVAAHDENITMLDISIPWLCNLGGYKDKWKFYYGRIKGWAPDYTLGISYFDTAVQATKVKCPARIMARLGDYTCPPSGIMALYNGLNTEKEISFRQNGTHGYDSPDCEVYTLNDKNRLA